jgi:hypothetical protein
MNWYNFLKFSEQGLWGQDVSKDLPLPDQGNRTLFDVNSIPNPPPVLFTGEGIIEDIGTNAQNCQDVQFLIDKRPIDTITDKNCRFGSIIVSHY